MIPIPFRHMAISLSGGGYRATTYHLGALSFLDYLKVDGEALLQDVKVISTISGGTLTGVMYALKLAEGGDFQNCFSALYGILEEDKLLEQALYNLNHPGKWKNKYKTRDMINAFAEAYNEHFYGEATFDTLFNGKEHHLSDIIFGCSEFSYGLQFRFQGTTVGGIFGNNKFRINDDVVKEIRLADAAAASSCFPGGFEPIVMPKDFGNGPDSPIVENWPEIPIPGTDKKLHATAMMDGGIIDNQGIEGVVFADGRRNGTLIGTYIISDVSGEHMIPYEVPKLEHSSFKDFFSLNSINFIAGIILFFALAYLLFLDLTLPGIVISSVIMTIIVLWFLIFTAIKNLIIKKISKMFDGDDLPVILKDLKVLLRTPVYILVYLIEFRVSSVLKMVTDIFMKRIRTLQINGLYGTSKWNGRLVSNFMYTLGSDNKKVPPALESAYYATNHMPTTLWFTEKEKNAHTLDKLIACGQFTLCYNLKDYCEDIKKKKYDGELIWDQLTDDEKLRFSKIEKAINKLWEHFNTDALWMVKEFKKGI